MVDDRPEMPTNLSPIGYLAVPTFDEENGSFCAKLVKK